MTEDGKVRYRVQIRLKGYPAQSATFERKTDAKEWTRQTEADMKARRQLRTVEAKRHTVSEMIDRYLRYVMPHKKANSRDNQTRRQSRGFPRFLHRCYPLTCDLVHWKCRNFPVRGKAAVRDAVAEHVDAHLVEAAGDSRKRRDRPASE